MRMTAQLTSAIIGLALIAPQAATSSKEITMHHAHGTFTVDMRPLTPAPAEGLNRFTSTKAIHGDLEATSVGEMLAGGDPSRVQRDTWPLSW